MPTKLDPNDPLRNGIYVLASSPCGQLSQIGYQRTYKTLGEAQAALKEYDLDDLEEDAVFLLQVIATGKKPEGTVYQEVTPPVTTAGRKKTASRKKTTRKKTSRKARA